MARNKFFLAIGSVFVFVLVAFQEPMLKKRITDTSFRYEFYVTDKEADVKSDRMYYWFKAGAIHNTENGIAGELLNDGFEKFYLNNQLAEKGEFRRGLKVGLWKTWYPNGFLETKQYWNEGRKKGIHYHYSNSGVLLEKGRYSADKKQGEWINFVSKDTATFNNGEKVIKVISEEDLAREAKRKASKAKRIKEREEKKATKKAEKKKEAKVKNPNKKGSKATKATSPKTETKAKKDNFFTRLFSKKKKSNDKGS